MRGSRAQPTPPRTSWRLVWLAAKASSLVVAGATALLALRDTVRLSSGERVLIRGTAGGVGTAAVQLAHAIGTHVTALARDRHATALADLGADDVLDYTTTSAEQIGPWQGDVPDGQHPRPLRPRQRPDQLPVQPVRAPLNSGACGKGAVRESTGPYGERRGAVQPR
jgi:hypothetical protein